MQRLLALLFLLALMACRSTATAPPTPGALPSAPAASTPASARSPMLAAPTASAAATPDRPTPSASAPSPAPSAPATPAPAPAFGYPIGKPGQPLGDGFFIRHGYTTENSWYNPGYWHTGEDWYALEGDTAGARVYAIASGTVVYAGANYPGRVVIVRHDGELFSMYGHLDPALHVQVGQQLSRGELIGVVLRRNDKTPNHLHFEIRAFLTAREVNGSAPRYNFRCGVNCPPGPGYWPIGAPELPSALGWRNPTHTIARRMLSPDAGGQLSAVVVASQPISQSVALWSAPPANTEREALGMLDLHPGERFSLIAVYAGAEDTRQTSAFAYQLWYQIGLLDGRTGWVQAAVPSVSDAGSDGRPSSIYFNFFPVVDAPF